MKTRKILSALLSLVMVMAQAVPAMAAEKTQIFTGQLGTIDASKIAAEKDVLFAEDEEDNDYADPIKEYTLDQGTTLYVQSNAYGGIDLVPALLKNGVYNVDYSREDETIALDGTVVLGPAHAGTWCLPVMFGNPVVLIITDKVVSEPDTPTEPTEPEQPTQPTEPAKPAQKTAAPSGDKLSVNGQQTERAKVYKIDDSNYVKLRDVAALLNGTSAQFNVKYDASTASVIITTGQGYNKKKSDLKSAAKSEKPVIDGNNTIVIDGVEKSLKAYKIGGNNYFQLSDLGEALGFKVSYQSGVATITTD